MNVQKGQIWVANLNPNKGAEIGKIRPVLILQDAQFDFLPTLLIAPLTTALRPKTNLIRPWVKARDLLEQDCQICVDQLRVLDRARLGEGPLTQLDAFELEQVEKSLLMLMDVQARL
jgi:mRNA interferase MazF